MTETLGDEFPAQLKRVKELKEAYDSIPTGVIGSKILTEIIGRAEKAWEDQDIEAMIQILPELKECE